MYELYFELKSETDVWIYRDKLQLEFYDDCESTQSFDATEKIFESNSIKIDFDRPITNLMLSQYEASGTGCDDGLLTTTV